MYRINIDNKNAILELLNSDKSFEKIYVAENAYKDPKTLEILKIARSKDIPIIKSPRRSINRKSRSGGTQSILAIVISENDWKLDDLLTDLVSKKQIPYFLILDHIKYAQNLGAIFRTAFASGVNGVILPVTKKNYVDSEVIRISMGACERIPVVQMSLFNAMKILKQNDISILALHTDGEIYYKKNLKGPLAFLIGAEDEPLSSKLLEKTDGSLSIPTREGTGELNLSVATGVLCYEKLRQEVC